MFKLKLIGDSSKFEDLKYIIEEIIKNYNNAIWWKDRILEYFIHPLWLLLKQGVYFLKERWDNLIILDACRYDVFKEELKKWDINGNLQYRITRGANTGVFLRQNFNKFHDVESEIIYITANPWVDIVLRKSKVKVISVWKYAWDESLDTVPPEAVYEKTIEIASKYPNKRIISHFLQPHGPYIYYDPNKKRYIRLSPSKENILELYKINLKTVMPYVAKLCKILPGRTIVTSDHGEALGEKLFRLPIRIYGHPAIRIEPLIKVPWLIVENKKDRTNLEQELVRLKSRNLFKKLKS